MDQAAYISVISYGCCSIEGGRQNLGNGEGWRDDEKERVRAFSHAPPYVIWSAALLYDAFSM